MNEDASISANQFVEQINRLGSNFHIQLTTQSLLFLRKLMTSAPFPFDQLLTKIEQHHLQLKACHVDKIVLLLQRQKALPETVLLSLDNYLLQRPDIESDIKSLLITHAPELIAAAEKHNFIHHALPHALEISNRVNTLMTNLGILASSDPKSRFLRAVIHVMVQFHDLEQKNTDKFNTVEEASAERVSRWITSLMQISDKSDLKLLVDFIADHVIVLGTTTIYSASRTMDLSELFIEFKKVEALALSPVTSEVFADVPERVDSKAGLLHNIDASMLIIGICDKNPAALYDLVAMQASNPANSTLTIMNSYFQTPLLLERFLTSKACCNLFNSGSSVENNQQAFIIALTQHLTIRAEVSNSDKQADANTFIQLIVSCRKERLLKLDHESFMAWFTDECLKREMNRVVSAFFFDVIEYEINFCKSQIAGLVFAANKLSAMRFSPKSLAGVASGHFQPLVNPQIPERDARNLYMLKQFYANLNESEQETFISELIFAVVVQAGEMEAERLGVIKTIDAPSDEPSFLDFSEFYRDRIPAAKTAGSMFGAKIANDFY